MAVFVFVNFSCGGMAAEGSGATAPTARRTESQAPAMRISEVGIEFNAPIAQQLAARRHHPDAKPLTLLSVGPGCPGLAPAPKNRVVTYPPRWTVLETPRKVGGVDASPEVLTEKLPEVLAGMKPEVVLLWGDVDGTRTMKPTERHAWEDVVTVCLRLGVLPIIVMPNGEVSFSGGGGEVGLVAQRPTRKTDEAKDEEQRTLTNLEMLRRNMSMVGRTRRVPQVEQAPFPTTSHRLARMLYLVEKYVLGRTPPEIGSPQTVTGTGTGSGNPDEVE